MDKFKKYSFFVGIDPGVNNGFAIYDTNKKELVKLQTLSFWDLIETLTALTFSEKNICVVIEDTNLNSALYAKQDNKHGPIRDKIAQNIGSNKRTATLIMEWLEGHSIAVRTVRPTSKSLTKIDAERFARYTKWTGKSSEHSRDAGMLVYGRTC